MKQKRIQSGSVRRRLLVLAAEILFGIAVVILILLYAIHEHDPWMPRPAVLTASSWMILGLVGIGVSVRTKQLQRKLLDRYAAKLPALESWLVPLALGVAAVVFGASRLSDIYRRGVLPNDTGRIALFTFYALSGTMSFVLGAKLLRWGFGREEQAPDIHAAKSEAISVKERISMVLPGALLAYEGVRLLISAWLTIRG